MVQCLLPGPENFRAIRKTSNSQFSDSEQPRSALMESPNTLSAVSESVGKTSGLRGEAFSIAIAPPPNRQPNWLIVG